MQHLRVRLTTVPHTLLTALLLSLALACGGGTGESPPTGTTDGESGAQATPQRGGSIVIGATADISSINEYVTSASQLSEDVLENLFLSLVEEQADFFERPPTIRPELAERWERSDDGKALTFFLRQDVRWSDGTPVTAQDVRFTWEAQTHPAVAWDAAYMKENVEDVEIIDDHTVRFHFSQVTPSQLMDANEGRIIPAHVWSELPFEEWRTNLGWFLQNQVVSGPFRLASWKPQDEIVLARNDGYFEPEFPYLDQVVIRFVPDRSNRISQLLSGGMDFIYGLTVEDMDRLRREPDVETLAYWSRGYAFIAWNNEHPLFREREVRQALALATDRQEIVDTIWGDYGAVAASPILTQVWAYNQNVQPWPYDPTKARELLAGAGWTDSDGDGILDRGGEPFSFEMILHEGNQQRIDAAVLMQGHLKKVGIDMQPRIISLVNLMKVLDERDFTALVAKYGIPTDLNLHYAFHTEAITGASNVFRFSNPEVDRLIDAAMGVKEPEQLRTYLDPLQEILHREQPLMFLWESQNLAATSARLHDAQPNYIRVYSHLWKWWVDPAES